MSSAAPSHLTVQECWACLASVSVGRLVYTERALPTIRPVNFSVADGHVVIWSRPGGKARALRGQVAAFQVDRIDEATGAGRNVVVIGTVSVVSDENESLSQIEPGRRPWVVGRLDHVIRLPVQRMVGQRWNLRPSVPSAVGVPVVGAATGETSAVGLNARECWDRKQRSNQKWTRQG